MHEIPQPKELLEAMAERQQLVDQFDKVNKRHLEQQKISARVSEKVQEIKSQYHELLGLLAMDDKYKADTDMAWQALSLAKEELEQAQNYEQALQLKKDELAKARSRAADQEDRLTKKASRDYSRQHIREAEHELRQAFKEYSRLFYHEKQNAQYNVVDVSYEMLVKVGQEGFEAYKQGKKTLKSFEPDTEGHAVAI